MSHTASTVQSIFSIAEAYEWFAPCNEPSVFAFVKSLLYYRLG